MVRVESRVIKKDGERYGIVPALLVFPFRFEGMYFPYCLMRSLRGGWAMYEMQENGML
jgi:hypothetical protein